MSISELAEAFGMRPSALRYYERLGLLAPAGRSSGRRLYDKVAENRLAFIVSARASGFTLAEIGGLIAAASKGTAPGKLWREAAKLKRHRIDREITRLQATRRSLDRKGACRCRTIRACERRLARELRVS